MASENGETSVGPNAKPLDAALTVGLLTAGAYAVAFSFESGYLTHFGIPAALAEVNIRSLLLCAAGGAAFFVFGQGLLMLMPADLPRMLRGLLLRTCLLIMITIMMVVALSPPIKTVLITLAFFSAMVLPDFLVPLFKFRGTNLRFAEKIERTRAEEKATAFEALMAAANRRLVLLALVVLLGALFAFLIGGISARRQQDFLVNEDCIALRVQAGNFLCAIWDGALTGEYEYREIAGTRLVVTRMGPLDRYEHQELRRVHQEKRGKQSAIDTQAQGTAPIPPNEGQRAK